MFHGIVDQIDQRLLNGVSVQQWRGLWGDGGLVLLVLWLLAQLNPALPFFGAGNITEEGGPRLYVDVLLVVAVGFSICGFALYVSVLMRATTGALRATVVLLSIALWLKFAASSMMLKPHFSAEWVSMGRVIGLAAGMAAFFPMRKLGRLASTTVVVPYSWVEGEPLAVGVTSSTGIETTKEIAAAVETPRASLRGFAGGFERCRARQQQHLVRDLRGRDPDFLA